MLYDILIFSVIFIHFIWILFVILIFLKTIYSIIKKDQKFLMKKFIRTFHLLGIIFVAILIFLQKPCPLTLLEVKLKMIANKPIYYGSFIIHYLEKIIYPDLPALLVELPSIFIAFFSLIFFLIYPPFKFKKFLLLTFFIFILNFFLYSQSEIEIYQNIKNVQLYQTSALIYSEADLKLSKGEQKFIIKNLPVEILDNTINVYKINKNSKFFIKDFSVKEVEAKLILQDKILELKNKLENLKDELNKKEDEMRIIENRLKFYESISAKTTDEASKKILTEKIDLKNIDEILKFITTGSTEALEQKRKKDKEIQNLKDEIKIIESQISEILNNSTQQVKILFINIYSEVEQEDKIGINYIISGNVSWHPFYEINYNSDKKNIIFSYYASVRQDTFEYWKDIKLNILTGEIRYDVTLPEIAPWIIEGKYKNEIEPIRVFKSLEKPAESELQLKEEQHEFQPTGPEIVKEELNFKVILPDKFTIPPSEDKKILINQIEIKNFDVSYNIFPTINSFAYLTAEFKNESELTILPGEVSLFLNNNFSGKANFSKSVKKDEKIKFSFGIDENIKVEKIILHKIKGKSGIFKNKNIIDFGAKIIVENYKEKNIEIFINEPLPFSQHKDIQFEVYEKNIEPFKIDERNIFIWKLKLQPKEKKEIIYKFKIIYPEDMIIFGI